MIEKLRKNFRNYRWFFTSNQRLVIGGKNEEQNEKLVKKIISSGQKILMMHTSTPGSPFTVILDNIKNIGERDREEMAVFTACFSKQWKEKEKGEVDIFNSEKVYKTKGMKQGTFGVKSKEKIEVKLKLWVKRQRGLIRAVPFKPGIEIVPGKLGKEDAAEKIAERLKVSKQEVLNAIPAGGFKIR